MARPSKPVEVMLVEGRTNLTKQEIELRRKGEQAVLTGESIRENQIVSENERAHEIFLRIRNLLRRIDKNDAIYENVINRYALMLAETEELVEKREVFFQGIEKLDKAYENKEIEAKEYFRLLAQMQKSCLDCDKQVDSKRRMLINIEKENLMTVAAALRSVPKQVNDSEEQDEMSQLLSRGRG